MPIIISRDTRINPGVVVDLQTDVASSFHDLAYLYEDRLSLTPTFANAGIINFFSSRSEVVGLEVSRLSGTGPDSLFHIEVGVSSTFRRIAIFRGPMSGAFSVRSRA